MKKIYTYKLLWLLIVVLTLAGCADETVEDTTSRSQSLKLEFSTLSVGARAVIDYTTEVGDDGLNENLIKSLDVFIFKASGGGCVHHEKIQLNITGGSGTSPLGIKQRELDENELYITYVIANYNGTFSSSTSLAELKNLSVSGILPAVKQESFLMDGHSEAMKLVQGGELTIPVELKRAASKVRMNVKFANGFSKAGDLQARLVNYATEANLLDEGTTVQPTNASLASLDGFATANSDLTIGATTTSDFVYYAYQNDWKVDIHRETYVIINVPLENKSNNYYRIPVNYRLPVDIDKVDPSDASYLYRMDRNFIYDVTVLIDKEGSDIPEHAVALDCGYTIMDWAGKNKIVVIDVGQWLWVKDDVLYMNNKDEIFTKFDSSAPDLQCTISDVRIYNQETPWTAGTVSAEATQTLTGTIKITSPVPDNFVGKQFKVTVSSATSGKSATIQVYQFPPLYLTLQANENEVNAGAGQTNNSLYEITAMLADFSNLSKEKGDYELNETWWIDNVYYKHQNTLEERQEKALDVVEYLQSKVKFGYPQTEQKTFTGVYSAVYNNVDQQGQPTKRIGNVTAQCLVESEENSKLVSPHFILASQGGANRITDYTTAKKNCAGYYEVVENSDGSTTTYATGTWRMPTEAELKLIDLLQNTEKSLIKKILEGYNYQYAKYSDNYWYSMMDGRVNSSAVRCVRDIK